MNGEFVHEGWVWRGVGGVGVSVVDSWLAVGKLDALAMWFVPVSGAHNSLFSLRTIRPTPLFIGMFG